MRVIWGIVAGLLVSACTASSWDEPVRFSGFDGDLLVLVDADMPAFAYADGVLEPHIAAEDSVLMIKGGQSPEAISQVAASNTVTTWPGSMAISSDGRFAYVIEGRQPPAAGIRRISSIEEGLPPGTVLSVIELVGDEMRRIATVDTLPLASSIALSPDGEWLAVTTDDPAAHLQLFSVNEGVPGDPETVRLPFETGIGPDAGRATYVAWRPQGDVLAVNLGSGGVGFISISDINRGAFRFVGGTLTFGRLLSALAWSPDGAMLYALDTGWGASRLDRVFNGPGKLHTVRFGADGSHELVSSLATGHSSEAFAVSPDGRYVATLNMERTYLPDTFPLRFWPRRGFSSVTLFKLGGSGLPEPAGEPVRFEGVLPQGIAFDEGSRALAVAVFQGHEPDSVEGWIQYFSVDGDEYSPRIRVTDRRVTTPRGGHFLVRVPSAP